MIKNRTTPEGRELGKNMAKFCDEAEPTARLKFPELPPDVIHALSGRAVIWPTAHLKLKWMPSNV